MPVTARKGTTMDALERERFTRGYLLKRVAQGGVGISALPAVLAACGGGGGGVRGGTLTVAHVEEVGTLDPKVWGGFAAIYVQSQIYDTLQRQDPTTLEIKPGLAVEWENPDPLTYRYTLRPGVKFHNGEPLTADDVAFTFNRIADPKEGAWEQYMFQRVEKATAVDELTVEVKMKEPDHQFQFIGYFEGGNILNRKHVEELGEEIGTNPVGCGPFKFVSRDPSQVVLERFDGYWEEGKPLLGRVEFRNIKDPTTTISGLRSGDIHLTYDVPKDQARVVEDFNNVKVEVVPGWEHTVLHMANGKEPFSDVNVRQAIRHAIDTNAALAGFGEKYVEPATGAFVPDGVPFSAYDETQGQTETDLEKARELLAQTAVANGFKATVAVNPGGIYEAFALSIQKQLQPLGIEIEIKRLPAPDTIALAYSHDFDMICMYWIADYTDISSFLLQWYGPNGGEFGPNFTEYSNPEYDRFYETALTTTDDAEREDAFRQCQLILTRDQPSICLAFPRTVRFTSTKVTAPPVPPVYVYDSYREIAFT